MARIGVAGDFVPSVGLIAYTDGQRWQGVLLLAGILLSLSLSLLFSNANALFPAPKLGSSFNRNAHSTVNKHECSVLDFAPSLQREITTS